MLTINFEKKYFLDKNISFGDSRRKNTNISKKKDVFIREKDSYSFEKTIYDLNKKRKDQCFSKEILLYLVKNLPKDKKDLLKEIIYIKDRENNQFSLKDIISFLKCDNETLAKAKDLFYIKDRGAENQFSAFDIISLVSLDKKSFEKAKKFFYLDLFKENQLSFYEIEEIVNLKDKNLKKVEEILFKSGIQDLKNVDFQDIIDISYMANEPYGFSKFLLMDKKNDYIKGDIIKEMATVVHPRNYSKVKDLLYIEGREDEQFIPSEIIALSSLPDNDFKKIKRFLDVQHKGFARFTANDIIDLVALREENFDKANSLFDIEFGDGNMFNGYEIVLLSELPDDKFKKMRPFIKENLKGSCRFDAYDICELVDIEEKNLEKIAPFINIENRDFQLSGESLKNIALLEGKELKRALYLASYDKKTFDGQEILLLIKLSDEEFNKAKNFFYIEGRNSQLYGDDIVNLVKLNKEELERADKLLYIPYREDKQLNGKDILTFSKYDDEKFKKALDLLENHFGNRYLTGKEISILSNSSQEDLADFYSFFTGGQFSIDKIIDIIYADYFDLSFSRKKDLYDVINNSMIYFNNTWAEEILANKMLKLKKLMNSLIKPIPVEKQKNDEFWHNFLVTANSKNEEVIKNLSKVIDNFEKTGLPLKYTRNNFTKDLQLCLEEVPDYKRKEILEKMGISLTEDKQGYNGFVDFSKLKSVSKEEVRIKNLCEKFLLNNEIKTGDKDTDKFLNSIYSAFPEMINIIGKRQHQTHKYTLDIHVLKVLENIVLNPEFSKLSQKDKMCIQLLALFHDIGKRENIVDKQHEFVSSIIANDILEKVKMPIFEKKRLVELIKNHNWLQKLNNSEITINDASIMFRNPNDIEIAKIFAEADLKAIGANFYEKYGGLIDKFSTEIEKSMDKYYSTGNMLFTTKINDSSKISEINYKGRKIKVLDLTKVKNNEDLTKYGLSEKNKKDINFLFHYGDLQTMDMLTKPFNESVICSSLLTPEKKATFQSEDIGMLLETTNANVINTASSNQSSGTEKDFGFFTYNVESKNRHRVNQMKNILSVLRKKGYNLSESDYSNIYKSLIDKKYLSQISDIKISDNKILKKEDLKEAYKYSVNDILQNTKTTHNEIVVYNPEVKGLLVVNDINKIDSIPIQTIDYIEKKGLPIIVLGGKTEYE